jgi:hypothetical protein
MNMVGANLLSSEILLGNTLRRSSPVHTVAAHASDLFTGNCQIDLGNAQEQAGFLWILGLVAVALALISDCIHHWQAEWESPSNSVLTLQLR